MHPTVSLRAHARRGVVVALVILAPIAGGLASRELPPSPPPPAPREEDPARAGRRALLDRAVAEAHANCEAAADLEPALSGPGRVLLETRDLEQALGADWGPALSPVERTRLLAAARFLRDLARGLETGPAAARRSLEAARLTPEDARFLLAAVHARLDRLRVSQGARDSLASHGVGPEALDPRKLRQFRALGFAAGLESFAP